MQPLAAALLLVVAACGLAELASRDGHVRRLLPPPSIGTRFALLEKKISEMDILAAKEGPFDCVFIGDSTVLRSIDPRVFSSSYSHGTSQQIRCYNLGVPGLIPYEEAFIAEMAVKRYHVSLVLAGTNVLDAASVRQSTGLINVPWMRDQRGEFAPVGWLIDHSMLYRTFIGINNMSPKKAEQLSDPQYQWKLDSYGYCPHPDHPGSDEIVLPTREYPSMQESAVEAGFAGFDRLRALGVQVIFYETLLSPQYLVTREDQPDFIREFHQFSQSHGYPFIEANTPNLVPSDGWGNWSHMNSIGASAFTVWLAGQVRDLADSGAVTIAPAFSR